MSTPKTPAEIEAMRAELAAYDAAKAAEAEAERLAYLAPVTSLIESDAFRRVYRDLGALRDTYTDNGNFGLHVEALHDIMPRLAQAAGVTIGSPEGNDDGE